MPPNQLATAFATNEARSRGVTLAGPPLGGFLFTVDRALPFLVDGISYLLAAVSILFLRRDLRPYWIWAALLPLFMLTSNPWQIGTIGALTAVVGPIWNVMILTYAGVTVPNELLGRVMSAAMLPPAGPPCHGRKPLLKTTFKGVRKIGPSP
ncbi:hypothetical protein [Actinoplanes campanulatus]|uniref:hypothetical protein n=1 Tax=Actinoplanes campanulatus TaxID=113559 RepID=UPI001953F907|nr:hypothetical protein [Actinoplanes capillaceus]